MVRSPLLLGTLMPTDGACQENLSIMGIDLQTGRVLQQDYPETTEV